MSLLDSPLGIDSIRAVRGSADVLYLEAGFGHDRLELRQTLEALTRLGWAAVSEDEDEPELTASGNGVRIAFRRLSGRHSTNSTDRRSA